MAARRGGAAGPGFHVRQAVKVGPRGGALHGRGELQAARSRSPRLSASCPGEGVELGVPGNDAGEAASAASASSGRPATRARRKRATRGRGSPGASSAAARAAWRPRARSAGSHLELQRLWVTSASSRWPSRNRGESRTTASRPRQLRLQVRAPPVDPILDAQQLGVTAVTHRELGHAGPQAPVGVGPLELDGHGVAQQPQVPVGGAGGHREARGPEHLAVGRDAPQRRPGCRTLPFQPESDHLAGRGGPGRLDGRGRGAGLGRVQGRQPLQGRKGREGGGEQTRDHEVRGVPAGLGLRREDRDPQWLGRIAPQEPGGGKGEDGQTGRLGAEEADDGRGAR